MWDGAHSSISKRLDQIRSVVTKQVPLARECISYSMAAFKLQRTFMFVGAFKKHIGIFPPVVGNSDLIRELAPFRGEKGNLSFPLEEPLPVKLIGKVTLALAAQR